MTPLHRLLAPEVYILASQERVYGVRGAIARNNCPLTSAKNMFIISLVKKLFVSISGLFTYLSTPLIALAVDPTPTPTGPVSVDFCTGASGIAVTLCLLGGPNLAITLRNIVGFFVVLAVVIALLYLLYGGIKWITSRGEKEQVEAARNHIIAAIVGLVVVFLAVFILSIVLAAFGIQFEKLVIPNITTK